MNNIKLKKLKEGQCLLVLGETGSGKSLFLKSILSDESGIKKKISINEIPYENFNIEQLQKLIGFAPQEMNFFDGTISENISFGQANEKALIECSKIAGCYDFIVKKKMVLTVKFQKKIMNIRLVNFKKYLMLEHFMEIPK